MDNNPSALSNDPHKMMSELEKARRDLAIANQDVQAVNEKLAAITEEMSASNEELSATNEELAAANEELVAINEDLQQSKLTIELLNKQLEVRIMERTRDLAESEQRMKSLVESAPFPIGVYVGKEMRILLANQNIIDVWGKGKDVIGKLYSEVLPELGNQEIFEQLDAVYTTGIPFHARNQQVDLIVDGTLKVYYFNYSFTPLYGADGEIYGVMNTAADVTDLQLAKQKVEQNEQNLQNMILQAPVAMCILLGPEHIISVANQLMIQLWGKPAETVMNRPIFEALPDATKQGLEQIIAHVYQTGVAFKANERPVELLRNGQQEIVYQNFVYEPYRDSDGKILGVIAITIDVTEQVLARKHITDVEERIRLAVEAAEIGTFDHDLISDELVASDRFNNIFGFDRKVPRSSILATIHPEDREHASAVREESYRSGRMLYDTRIVHKDNSIHWVRVNGKVYHDDNKRPLRVIGTILDITEFKDLQQQKDDFISIASHELKTPITSLKASLQLLERLKDTPDSPVLPRLIEQSGKSMNKITELVDDLLNVTRMTEGQIRLNKSVFTISKMIDECCAHIRLADNFELIFKGDKSLQVYADDQRIDQVIVNFVNNAVKYAPDSKEIHLIVEKRGDMAWIAVRDFGPGISAQKIPYLFERFYRADESGLQLSGLGLGLYISSEIIKRHEGQIGVDSEPGKGSTFWFTLPCHP